VKQLRLAELELSLRYRTSKSERQSWGKSSEWKLRRLQLSHIFQSLGFNQLSFRSENQLDW
jgi:hypothetical protein